MKLLRLFPCTILFSNVRSYSSLTSTKKICKDCKYFIGNDLECGKFGETNIVTGKITYNFARVARGDVKMCGEDAIHFQDNRFKIITIPYYFFKDNLLLVISGGVLGFYIYEFFRFLNN